MAPESEMMQQHPGELSDPFRHEALLYAGEEAFVESLTPWIREGVARGEPILVVVNEDKIRLLRSALGRDARDVRFADMREVGRNPARIIPAWSDFVAEGAGRRMRGIGGPIWAERTPAEFAECSRHEALLNLAFGAAAAGMWLRCPYDVETLTPEVLVEAERNHPVVDDLGRSRRSRLFPGLPAIAQPWEEPLPEPGVAWQAMSFERDDLAAVRRFVEREAVSFGLDADDRADLVLATAEVATNSVRHGGGSGTLRMWWEGDTIVCDFRDEGRIDDPMVGRQRPDLSQASGFGLWLANQLCDLVQIRTDPAGSTVRLHLRRP